MSAEMPPRDGQTGPPGSAQESVPWPWAGFLLGVAMVVAINTGAPYAMYIIHSSDWAISYLPLSVVFLFSAIVFINAAAVSLTGIRGLSRTDLSLTFIMALIGASIPTWGTSTYLIAVIAAPQFFASAENEWQTKVVQHIKEWLIPQDMTALRWFYNGKPANEPIPWDAWVVPLFWWISLVMAIFFLCHCLVAALRRQWVEHERLPFPLMELPQQLIATPEGTRWPAFIRQRSFWIGFAVPFSIVMWNVITYFTPVLPQIPTNLGGAVSIGPGYPAINTNINFAIVGFTYFVHLDVSFSIWFFTLLTMVQEGLFNRFGYAIAGKDIYTFGHPGIGWQGFGALTAMVLSMFWMARSHLHSIWRKAVRNDPAVDDSGELMSYRTIVVGGGLSALYICLWMWRSGISPLASVLFLLATVVLYTGITRVVMEGGLLFVRGPLIAPTFVGYAMGGPNMPVASHISMGLHYGWHHELKGFFMAASANSSKISDLMRTRRRPLTLVILGTALLAVLVSMAFTLYMGYSYGAYNYGGWIFGAGSQVPFVEALRKQATHQPDFQRLGHMGLGALLMAGLTTMRYRFAWWPLHPIGLPVGICAYPVTIIVFSVFLSWFLKWVIMRAGGIRLYRGAQPFFIGLIMGYFTAIGISFVIDVIWFPGQGHPLYGN